MEEVGRDGVILVLNVRGERGIVLVQRHEHQLRAQVGDEVDTFTMLFGLVDRADAHSGEHLGARVARVRHQRHLIQSEQRPVTVASRAARVRVSSSRSLLEPGSWRQSCSKPDARLDGCHPEQVHQLHRQARLGDGELVRDRGRRDG